MWSSSKEGAWRRSAKACIEFNQAMIEELRQLRKQGAKHVILAAQWAVPGIWQTELGLWEEALSHVIEKITATGLSVSIFADVPNYKWNVANCIARRGIEACSQNRERALAQTAEAMITLKRIAAQFEGVHIWDPLSELCVNERCIVMRDGVVLYSDNQHLSVAGARLLAPAINRFLINRGNNNL